MIKTKNAICYSQYDKEDGGFLGHLIIPCEFETYAEAFEKLKPLLESTEMVDYVIEEFSVEDQIDNDDDETMKFKGFKEVKLENYRLVYVFSVRFEDEEEDDDSFTWELELSQDSLTIVDI